jgi:hypothetical protein
MAHFLGTHTLATHTHPTMVQCPSVAPTPIINPVFPYHHPGMGPVCHPIVMHPHHAVPMGQPFGGHGIDNRCPSVAPTPIINPVFPYHHPGMGPVCHPIVMHPHHAVPMGQPFGGHGIHARSDTVSTHFGNIGGHPSFGIDNSLHAGSNTFHGGASGGSGGHDFNVGVTHTTPGGSTVSGGCHTGTSGTGCDISVTTNW